jgi:hypothetical protein
VDAEIGMTMVVGVEENDVRLRREGGEQRVESKEKSQKAHGRRETKPQTGHSGKGCVCISKTFFTGGRRLF